MKRIIVTAVLMVMLGGAAALAGTTQDVNISFEIPQVFELEWLVDGSTVDLTGAKAITVAEFDQGFKEAISGGSLEATANNNFDITVRASGVDFIGGSNKKPTSDLQVEIDLGAYEPLNGPTDVTIIAGESPGQNIPLCLRYKVLLYPNDIAGIYRTTLTYTIKATI
jgi:hypothetical protein